MIIYADGSCAPINPVPGGWAFLLVRDNEIIKESYGCKSLSTNNEMELMAIYQALITLPVSTSVEVRTDSSYAINSVSKWADGWQRNGWVTGSGSDIKNPELIKRLWLLKSKYDITWTHVKGHNGEIYNERVDKLANHAARNQLIST